MKVAAIIQARMGSTRLPGKVLKQVLGKALLTYEIERVQRARDIDQLLVATTKESADDAIVSLCKSINVPCFRGSEADVLERYYLAAVREKADVIVRLTADCPLIDPAQIDKVTETFFHHDYPLQYVSNTLNRTLPRGMDTEVFSLQALTEAYQNASLQSEREHVTRYMVSHPEIFHLRNVSNSINYSKHRWTVDTAEDFKLVRKIIENLYPAKPHFTMEDIIQLLEQKPEWKAINAHVEQKKD
ncbi:cytidylyltransferase domain-containing protein [Sediminibacillus massiliensis]|uniref:cytidylyltransferase domain-containing protein n=1 Tax=Sediminibacillus massiliensis TaxID=1926277 RepID=UPI0009883827|nr:glycosyltransferase family protein [Sediminibacillus massiliensis]